MTTTLTTTELAMLETMEVQAQSDQISFWKIYEWLGDLLEAKDVPITDPSLLWVRGATEANADRGSFSDLIRVATETQHQLRYGTNIPEGKMQEASNQVAQNLINDLLGRNNDWPLGLIPDIERIALADARAVGQVLFSRDPNPWDAVNYDAKMPNGSALPAWVSFDALTRTLTATPQAAQVGTLQFVLWGKDAFGYGVGQYVTLQVGAAPQPAAASAAAASAPEALTAAWPQTQAPTVADLGGVADVAPAADASARESLAAALPREASAAPTATPTAQALSLLDFEARNAALWRDFGDTVGLSAYHVQRQEAERAREAARWITPAPLAAATSGSALERQAQINTQVDLMIHAMAAFGAPPPMGHGSYRDQQQPPGAFFPPISIGPN